MANDLSTRTAYPGYTAGDLAHIHRPGAVNTDYKATPASLKAFAEAIGISHASLVDKSADEHPQYLTTERGDVRYYTKGAIDTTVTTINSRLSALEASSGSGGGSAVVWAGYSSADSSLIDDGDWAALPINTEARDLLTLTITNGELTLPVGSYEIYASAYLYISTDNAQPSYQLAIATEDTGVWTIVEPAAYVVQPLSAGSGDDNGMRVDIVVPVTLNAVTKIRAQFRCVGHAVTAREDAQLIIRSSTAGTGSGEWGQITGVLSNQADLVAALGAKSDSSHVHSAATISAAGFLSAADKTKLDGIEAGADVNPSTADIAAALDTYLGSTAWRTGGSAGMTLLASLYNDVDSSAIAALSTGNVNFDTINYPTSSPPVSVSGGEITINDTGLMLIVGSVTGEGTTANTKIVCPATLKTNDSGSWATILPGEAWLTEAGSSATTYFQTVNSEFFGIYNFATTGKKIKVELAPATATSAVKTRAKQCNIRIFKISAASGGGGSGSPATWYDEDLSLGQQTKLKFKGAGVTAAVVGDAVEVTIPGTALVAGADRQVQFNAAGASAGAAGVNVRSPANTRSLTNHVLQATNFEFDLVISDIVAGGTATPDPADGAEWRLVFAGNATISAAAMGGADLANSRMRMCNVVLFNNTANTITISTPTGAAASGLWTRAWGADGLSAASFQLPAYARRECAAVVYKDASGVIFTEWRG